MFGSVEAMLSASADKPLWRAVLEDDCQDRDANPDASLARMGRLWQAMKESLEEYDPARRSASGLSGGQGARSDGRDRSPPRTASSPATAYPCGPGWHRGWRPGPGSRPPKQPSTAAYPPMRTAALPLIQTWSTLR